MSKLNSLKEIDQFKQCFIDEECRSILSKFLADKNDCRYNMIFSLWEKADTDVQITNEECSKVSGFIIANIKAENRNHSIKEQCIQLLTETHKDFIDYLKENHKA